MLKNKFDNTNIYKTYNELLNDAELIDLDHTEFYENLISELKTEIKCSINQPTKDQIDLYIQENEYIEDTDIDEFRLLIRNMFENSQNISQVIKINKKKENIRLKKEILTQKHTQERQNKLLQKNIWSSTICICDLCNEKYTQANRTKHMLSSIHKSKVDAISWILTKIDGYDELKQRYITYS
jgi:hypothetical protein